MSETVQVAPARFVTIELASKITGLSPGAIRKRVERGQWLEGREFYRPTDGRVWVDHAAARLHLHRAAMADLLRKSRLQHPYRPAWADRRAIRRIYEECARLTVETGVAHEVDHVIPVRGRFVTGLHVESNLQIITRAANQAKSNAYVA